MKKKIKQISINDLISPFVFALILPISLVFKIYNKSIGRKIILLSEDPKQARDNGYELYKYLEKQNINDIYYAITKNAPDKNKIKKENIVKFYSLKHWLYYLSAYRNVSIHKASSPSPALFYLLHKYKIINGNRIFLQHGVTLNKVDYLRQDQCNFLYYITASERETDFIVSELGYNKNEVKLLGFSRFDRLYTNSLNTNYQNVIAIMPTWRSYLRYNTLEEFKKSNYYIAWNSLLNNSTFLQLVENRDLKVIFYLHRNFDKYSSLFTSSSKNIQILNQADYDIQELILNSKTLITDYSSVSMDFAFMEKPIIYFQFDKKEFREHLSKGYFSYDDDGFGKVLTNESELVSNFKEIVINKFNMDNKYVKRKREFFKYNDDKNSERICRLIYDDK